MDLQAAVTFLFTLLIHLLFMVFIIVKNGFALKRNEIDMIEFGFYSGLVAFFMWMLFIPAIQNFVGRVLEWVQNTQGIFAQFALVAISKLFEKYVNDTVSGIQWVWTVYMLFTFAFIMIYGPHEMVRSTGLAGALNFGGKAIEMFAAHDTEKALSYLFVALTGFIFIKVNSPLFNKYIYDEVISGVTFMSEEDRAAYRNARANLAAQ